MIRYLILVTILFTSCSLRDNKRLDDFNSHIGIKKSSALDKITASFEDYLSERYPELIKHDFHDKFCCFLHDIAEHDASYLEELTIPDSLASIIVRDFQNCGLDKELFIKVKDSAYMENQSSHVEVLSEESLSDNSDIENNQDSLELSDFNLFGDYHQALLMIHDDDFISSYVEARENQGDMTLLMLLPTFIDYCDKADFNDPVIKRIVTMEIFIQIVYSSLK